jgi:flavin reductase (DIM6/NTAB) family NADH-FMN oxidoreductase RutF
VGVGKDEFRAALGRFASGVTVVTTNDCEENRPLGITVSAFSSVSLEPPLVLICIDKGAYLHDYLKNFGAFGVNILAEEQDKLSNLFASRENDKFKNISYSVGQLGVPLLNDVLVNMECRTTHVYEGGDHTIFVGEVVTANVSDANPLLYFYGGYGKLIR